MIEYPPDKRVTAQETYAHEWISEKKFNILKPGIAHDILSNLKNFHVYNYVV